jgi:uncharacterized membrane protein
MEIARDLVHQFAGYTALVIEACGVAAIAIALARAAIRYAATHPDKNRYRRLRHDIGRGLLLGLELLVAADVVRTVASPSLEGVLLLGLVVLIRTFLSVALLVELEGRWPWKAEAEPPHREPEDR